MNDWNPAQYHRFAAERAQPFWDLVTLVEPGELRRAVDLGCGSGELTAAAAERLAVGEMLGIDSSPAMLDAAAAHSGPRTRFAAGDIATRTSAGDVDLVLANASLQWAADHRAVLTRWVAALAPGGQIAVQVPANADHPSHTCSVEVAASEPFRSAMGAAPPPDPVAANVLAPEEYAALLFELGISAPHVRLQVYPHVLDTSADVVEWVKGTSLTRYFTALPDELHEPFVDACRARLLDVIGDRAPYLYPFKRILMWGRVPPAGTSGRA
jgi:trans-aconitate 2-methyltransferase